MDSTSFSNGDGKCLHEFERERQIELLRERERERERDVMDCFNRGVKEIGVSIIFFWRDNSF